MCTNFRITTQHYSPPLSTIWKLLNLCAPLAVFSTKRYPIPIDSQCCLFSAPHDMINDSVNCKKSIALKRRGFYRDHKVSKRNITLSLLKEFMTESPKPKNASREFSKLRNEREKYRLIFEHATDAIFIGNSLGEFIEVNESAVHLTGYSKDELLTKTMPSLFSNEELSKHPLRFDLLQKGEIVKVTRNLARKDGSLIPIEMNSRMLPNGSLQAVVRDISDHARMKQDLEDLLGRQQVIIDAAFEAIFISIKGICVGQNREAREMFGYTDKEAIGRAGTDWIIPEQRNRVMQKMLSEHEGSYETVGLRKDGTEFPVEIQARMTTYSGEKARVTALRDITLRKKAEHDLLTIQKLESLGTLAGGLAHDLNNILTGLFGNLSLAKLQLSPTALAYTYIQKAEESLTRFTHITNKLLTFSKGGKPVIEPADLANLVREIVHFDLAGSNVNPVLSYEQQLWRANIDKGQIQQVFSNLIINANQAMPNGGNLYINLANCNNSSGTILNLSPGSYVKAEIRDEGEGIALETQKNIFDPYFTTKANGTGLGLASAYSIVSQHKGLITVTSEIGKGTLFEVYLTASQENGLQSEKQIGDKEKAMNKKHKVLLVDDDSEVCNVGTNLLKALSCSVVIANNTLQAVDKFTEAKKQNQPFDIAILDLTIPGELGGADTVKRLLQIDQNTKMIVSSGYSDSPIMANYKEFGFSAILAKPYTIEKLIDVLKKFDSHS